MHKGYKLSFFVFLITVLISCGQNPIKISEEEKINGLSFVASRDTITQRHIEPLKSVYANWVSIMPFGFMNNLNSTKLYYNHPQQWYGERLDGVEQSIEIMHKNNIKVMLKPQIWIRKGEFTGYIEMLSEEDWASFESNYKGMILKFAEVAEQKKVEMFCIGTELNKFVTQRPEFWRSLIASVKKKYTGKITYAENWDKIKSVSFWSELDFIGVDAYFPISDEKTPGSETINSAWKTINSNLKELSDIHQIPVLFTEFGYRSADFAGKEPWNSEKLEGQINQKAQVILLQGLFDNVWSKDWFAGGFLWKWFHDPKNIMKWQENRFSVHGKKAEKVLTSNYEKYSE